MKFSSLVALLLCMNIQSAFASGPAIFGSDQRTQMTSTEFPWKAIGKLSLANGAYCTATMISACLVLTAAHCVIDSGTHQLTDQVITFDGSNGGPSATAARVWWGTQYVDVDQNKDWAIVKLNQNLGDQLGWFGIQNWQGEDNTVHANIIIAGYPSDLDSGKNLTVQQNVNVCRTTSDNILKTDADTYRGDSGSAIWYWGTGFNNPQIIGVFTRSYMPGDTNPVIPQYSENVASSGVASAQFLATVNQVIAQGCN
jgi:V8-like Glu-specific endopeptidase